MTHAIRWVPGRPGKGWLLPGGNVLTWNTDVLGGSPHHYSAPGTEALDPENPDPDAVPFVIDADGGVATSAGDAPDSEAMAHLRAVEPSLRRPARSSLLAWPVVQHAAR